MPYPEESSTPNKNYRRVVYIVTEGDGKAEKEYIDILKELFQEELNCNLSVKKPSNSAIRHQINKAKEIKADKKRSDRIWILTDRDEHSHKTHQLNALKQWVQKSPINGVILSNPRFEYWLLLHFEDHPKSALVEKNKFLEKRLSLYITNYSRGKGLRNSKGKISRKNISSAYLKATKGGMPCLEDTSFYGTQFPIILQDILPSIFKESF